MKKMTITLEQKLKLGWLIGLLTGNVALIRIALAILEKLQIPDPTSSLNYTVNLLNGEVAFPLKGASVAKIIPAPVGKIEKPDEVADREAKNAQAVMDANHANDVARRKIASTPSTIELTEAEGKMLADTLAARLRGASDAHSWIDGIVIEDANKKPVAPFSEPAAPFSNKQ